MLPICHIRHFLVSLALLALESIFIYSQKIHQSKCNSFLYGHGLLQFPNIKLNLEHLEYYWSKSGTLKYLHYLQIKLSLTSCKYKFSWIGPLHNCSVSLNSFLTLTLTQKIQRTTFMSHNVSCGCLL